MWWPCLRYSRGGASKPSFRLGRPGDDRPKVRRPGHVGARMSTRSMSEQDLYARPVRLPAALDLHADHEQCHARHNWEGRELLDRAAVSARGSATQQPGPSPFGALGLLPPDFSRGLPGCGVRSKSSDGRCVIHIKWPLFPSILCCKCRKNGELPLKVMIFY